MYADKYFAVEDYYLAAEYYTKELDKNPSSPYATYQLAECYRYFMDYDNAEKWYKRADELAGDQFPLAAYYHATMLKINGKYEPAVAKFEYFIATYEPQGSSDEFLKFATLDYNGAVLALDALKKPQRDYSFHNVGAPVNTEFSEFAPTIWESDTSIIIASARITDEKEEQYGRLGGAFLDNYRFEQASEGWREVFKGEKGDKFEELNSKYHDAAGCFNKDQSKYYFTRCAEKGGAGEIGCAIYITKKEDDKWGKPVKLNANVNAEGWNAHPTLSTNSDTMFFASKRSNGQGMTDIWYSVNSGGEEWSEAVNLGPSVNTELIDQSPNYYSEEHVLFYASNGKEGLGGLDIFMAKGADFGTIRNIGLPFNSNRDDFYMVLGADKGYLSSNRDGGLGNDDIYMFNIRSKEALVAEIETDTIDAELITIKGRIADEEGRPVPEVKVLLLNQDTDEVLKMTYTDNDGVFIFANLDPSINYKVVIDEEDAQKITAEIDYNVDDLEIIATGKTEEPVLAVVEDPVVEEDPIVEEDPVDEKPVTKDELDNLVAADKPFRVLFENVYFDFSKSVVRTEGKKVLSELADYANENPGIKIEITAHTDNVGTNEYNYVLAKRRGNAAYNYLISKGVPKSAIIINAVGEDKPLASNSNDVGRQLNRRVEFHVSGGNAYEPSAMVYVVPKRTSIADVAQQFNMSVDEVKELNGLSADELAAYKPVRVRRTLNDDVIATQSLNFSGAQSGNSPYFDKEAALNSARETMEVATTGYNAGVKYYKYDGSGYYIVLPRNTLFSIAKITGTSMDEIRSLNNLDGNRIYPGQRLKVSTSASAPTEISESYDNTAALADAGIAVSDQQGQVVDIGDGQRYVVKEGDNFYTICKQFDMSFEELRIANNLPDYGSLRAGMALKVKAEEGESSATDTPEISEESGEEGEELGEDSVDY